LQFDDLLVGEGRTVVHDLHRVGRFANPTRADGRLRDLATVNINFDSVVTDLAAEEGFFHVRDDRGGADNETLDGDQFVHVYNESAYLCLTIQIY
jgi:hypothetical protein